MSTEIAKPTSPMEQFQEGLKERLRNDIAQLLPEDVIKSMIAKVVQDEFFEKRKVRKPGSREWDNEWIIQGTKFQDMVFEAAKPILTKLAQEWATENADVIADHWRKVTDAGLIKYVEGLQAQMATQALKDHMNGWLDNMNMQRQQQGLAPIPRPYF